MYEYFEYLLQKFGVTPYKVSKETGVSQSTLSDWKRGISTPKNDKLQKIADYFGVSVEFLMTGKEKEGGEKYYINDETASIAQEIFDDKELRHYAATIMHAMGIPEAYIMERGGWKTNTVLNQVYRGTRSDFSKKYSDKTNEYFDKML